MSLGRVFLAGHNGMVGSSIHKLMYEQKNVSEIITVNRKELDLTKQKEVFEFIKNKKPDYVVIASAKVGGIMANNNYPAEFIYDNLMIECNLIHGSYIAGVQNLLFLGSSCIYPKNSPQPIKEKYLLSSELEKTNEAYAIAKIAGIKMCESYNLQYKTNYKCIMPTNTFGPNDNYDKLNSHFFPALIRKAHECKLRNKKSIEVWGSGKPLRELIFVDDIADACIYFMTKKIKYSLVNIGTGKHMTIKKYTNFLLKKLNLKVKIKFNKSRPDGVYKKVLDVKRAKKLGWKAKINLDKGFDITYRDFLNKY